MANQLLAFGSDGQEEIVLILYEKCFNLHLWLMSFSTLTEQLLDKPFGTFH